MFERSLEENKTNFRSLEFSSGTSLRRCLAQNIGLAFLPDVSIAEEVRQGSLCILGLEPAETSVLLIWHVEKWCSPLLLEFMQEAVTQIRPVSLSA